MKRILLLLLLILPFNVKAVEYDVKSANMKIKIPDEWYVFTRENLENNKNLKNQETIDYMNNFFYKNNAYIDAVNSNIEMVLRLTDVNFKSLSELSDEKIEEIAKDLGALNKTEDIKIYENKYKYVNLGYKSGEFNILTFATVINDKWYTFSAQKKSDFSADEALEIKKIIDSVDYTIIETIEKEETEKKFNINFKKIGVFGIIGVFIIAFAIILKKKKVNN